MQTNLLKTGVLTGNQLKILAIIAMTSDHVGKLLLPEIAILQIIGRLAFPIFAYMISEGCAHTRSRVKYFATMASMAFGMQIVYYLVMRSMYMSIFVTFSISIGLIYIADYAKKSRKISALVLLGITAFAIYWISEILPSKLSGTTDFYIDYGFWGIVLPAFVFLAKNKKEKLVLTASVLIIDAYYVSGGIQWYALLALIPLALYNGKRGKLKMKWFFYIYYPVHMAVIYIIGLNLL